MGEPTEARVRDVALTVSAVDGESLLSPQLMQRVVSAVLAALAAQRDSEESRRRDVSVGADCGCHGEHG